LRIDANQPAPGIVQFKLFIRRTDPGNKSRAMSQPAIAAMAMSAEQVGWLYVEPHGAITSPRMKLYEWSWLILNAQLIRI
jgi:hypothetical protein